MAFNLLLACIGIRAAIASTGPVLHQAPDLPCSWRKAAHFLPQEHPLTIRFSLKQQNLEALKRLASDVSDPRSSFYGRFVPRAEISRLTAPDSAHVEAVEDWLVNAGVTFNRIGGGQTIEAVISVAAASKLLNTEFHHAYCEKTKQRVLRAGDFWLPSQVHEAVAAVYGLHGLPAPPREVLRSSALDAPEITPAVLSATYKISGVKASNSMTNRQAVAEFQGETTNGTDLKSFFKRYVEMAPVADAQVYRFVGNNGTGPEGDEAGLDIQYIMGLAPGIKTEFWYWEDDDFCADLKNWTDAILADDQAPLVHSVSYGYQGPLDGLGCADSHVGDIDINFAKLAAKGVTIIFSSGDSGAGYQPSCSTDMMATDTAIKGEFVEQVEASSAAECCTLVDTSPASGFVGWTYKPPPAIASPTCTPQRGQALQGEVIANGEVDNDKICCSIATDGSYSGVKGYTFDATTRDCTIFGNISGWIFQKSAISSHVPVLKVGECKMYDKFTSTVHAAGEVSGGAAVRPPLYKLYPSWPASSPWVTSVGATRFIDQKIGHSEMASDSFGSGGGFSTMFDAFKDQVDAVNHYLQVAPNLPPTGTFPAGGRATPDVSALGEGYQVISDGFVESVDGTSASAPAFAAMVSLLNDARLQAGRKQMGYLNPFLYQNADAFMDVTVGTNALGRGNGPTEWGFNCTKGWDPATGLGTPIFPKLLQAALSRGGDTIFV